jgi:hypothetical protein
MKKRMNKKAVASDLWLEVGQTIAAVLIIIVMVGFGNNIVDKGALPKDFYARDIALLTTTIHALPGNLIYYYSVDSGILDDQPFTVKISNNQVDFTTERLKVPSRFWFIGSDRLASPQTLIEKSLARLRFTKDAAGVKVMSVQQLPDVNLRSINCPDSVVDWKAKPILIKADKDVELVAQNFASRFNRQDVQVIASDKEFTDDALVLHMKRSDDASVRVYYRDDLKEKEGSILLGCTMLNEFLKKEDVTDTVLLPMHGVDALIPAQHGLTIYVGDVPDAGKVLFDGVKNTIQ